MEVEHGTGKTLFLYKQELVVHFHFSWREGRERERERVGLLQLLLRYALYFLPHALDILRTIARPHCSMRLAKGTCTRATFSYTAKPT